MFSKGIGCRSFWIFDLLATILDKEMLMANPTSAKTKQSGIMSTKNRGSGIDGVGKPAGISPTTATSNLKRYNNLAIYVIFGI